MKKYTLINTENSSLEIVEDIPDLKNIIDTCVIDVMPYLLKNPQITVFGKTAIQHRNIGFFSDTSIGYYYSRKLLKSQKLSENLIKLLNLVNELLDTNFNGILVNEYISGLDYIGKHSDDEKALSKKKCVVSISSGAIRKFRIRNKETNKIVMDISTIPYTFIIMNGDFQTEFTHEIPQEKKIKESRISFTFRYHTV